MLACADEGVHSAFLLGFDLHDAWLTVTRVATDRSTDEQDARFSWISTEVCDGLLPFEIGAIFETDYRRQKVIRTCLSSINAWVHVQSEAGSPSKR